MGIFMKTALHGSGAIDRMVRSEFGTCIQMTQIAHMTGRNRISSNHVLAHQHLLEKVLVITIYGLLKSFDRITMLNS